MTRLNNKQKSYDVEAEEQVELHGSNELTTGNHRRKSTGRSGMAGCCHCTCTKKCWITALKNNLKVMLLIVAIFAGTALGFLMREFEIHKDPRKIMYVAFIGDIFLRMLKIVILPLIVSSLISGLAALESQTSGKIGLRAVVYYFTTTVMAVILGIILVTIIRPGKVGGQAMKPDDTSTPEPITTADTFLDLIRNMFPPNLVSATFRQYKTQLVEPLPPKINGTILNTTTLVKAVVDNTTGNITEGPKDYSHWIIKGTEIEGINIMGLVVFSIVFGITISRLGEKGKPLMLFFESLNEATMSIVAAIMWLAPLGITFLVAGQVLLVKDFGVMLFQLGYYFLTVLSGLLIHAFVVLPIIFFLFTRKNPFTFIIGSLQAFATGFATSSSSATLPITIRCVEENNGVDPRITRFVLPIGSTINMDGTALYEAVACLFIAQTQDVAMDPGKIVAVSITATAAAIGAAGVPQAGLVTMVMVLNAVGLDAKYVSMILAIDWFLDRIRTTVNILGDVIGCGIVQHLSKDFLAKMDEEQKLKRRASRAQRLQEVMEDVEVESALLPKNEVIKSDNTVVHVHT
ncbi:excitatory amino acid transporter 3-like [Paramacrobiotus metropolitanus]|uniref:excitatory amino acid transporter 3-like n=1 Tax=Paramacrobiotus metropolitanus TaxID=2943436 RepID=UPI002445880B|nr:excitatory amino acid transporter 3-like [Paramacrobiotus metropolitanus]